MNYFLRFYNLLSHNCDDTCQRSIMIKLYLNTFDLCKHICNLDEACEKVNSEIFHFFSLFPNFNYVKT